MRVNKLGCSIRAQRSTGEPERISIKWLAVVLIHVGQYKSFSPLDMSTLESCMDLLLAVSLVHLAVVSFDYLRN